MLPLLLCLAGGCSRWSYEDASPDKAGPALRTALEAWKSGKTPKDLTAQTPSIVMNEGDWEEGKRLVNFVMDEQGSMVGRQVRWKVQVKLQDRDGRVVDRKIAYIIDTTPRLVIVRDIFPS